MSRLNAIRTFTYRITLTVVPFLMAAPVAAEEAHTALQTVSSAQLQAASAVPATPVYEFAAGARYEITAAPLHVTVLALQPGEEIVGSVAGGDTVRWGIIVDKGDKTQHHVYIKPNKAGLATNMIVRTNRRIYLLDLRSVPADAPFMVSVGWTYPDGPRAQTASVAGSFRR